MKPVIAIRVLNRRTVDKYKAVREMGKTYVGSYANVDDILLDWLSSLPQAKIVEILKKGVAKQ